MTFRASVLTLYPEMFPGALGLSLAGRALGAGAWSLDVTQIRDDAQQTHYFNNAVVRPESLYEYDAIHRLIRSTGRESAMPQTPL